MSKSKPMSYVSLRTILQHAEPNFRIHLSQKIPSIQCTEKTVPLRLENLDIEPEKIIINFKPYSIEIMEFQPKLTLDLKNITKRGESSKPPFEVDKYGLRIFEDIEHLTPGDVKLGDVRVVDEEEHLQELKDEIKMYKRYISEYNNPTTRNNSEAKVEFRRKLIEVYTRRRKNLEPQFRNIMVFKTAKSREILEYNGNLSLALKYLTQKLLGGRVTIKVKNLNLECGRFPVLRLPESLKLRVENLDVAYCSKPLTALQPILCPSSFPLKVLIVDMLRENNSEFLSSAQLLVSRWCFGFTESHRAYFRVHYTKLFTASVMHNLRSWKQESPRTGTHFSFSSNSRCINNILVMLKNETGAVSKERSVILPLNDDLEVLLDVSNCILAVKHTRTESYQLNLKVRKSSSS